MCTMIFFRNKFQIATYAFPSSMYSVLFEGPLTSFNHALYLREQSFECVGELITCTLSNLYLSTIIARMSHDRPRDERRNWPMNAECITRFSLSVASIPLQTGFVCIASTPVPKLSTMAMYLTSMLFSVPF